MKQGTTTRTKRHAPVKAHAPLGIAKDSARRSQERWAFTAICVLLLLAIAPYVNSLRNGFVWDDQLQIVMNPDLRPGADWGRLFSSGVWGHLHQGAPASNIYYRPLQMATYRSVVTTAGVNSFALHLVSVIFAAVSALLAFGLFWMMTGNRNMAFAAAALFAVHPVHTEAVDWISALPDIGCTIFVLAGFLSFLSACDVASDWRRGSVGVSRWWSWGLSLICFAVALLWKETAAVFPLLIGTYLLLIPPSDDTRHRIRSAVMCSAPFWILLAGYLLLRLQLLGVIAATQRNWQLSPLQLALTLPHLMGQYWWKLLAPVGLNAYHVFSPVTSLLDPRGAAAVLFIVAAGAIGVYAARTLPLAAFGAAWVFITLLPVMNIYAVGRNVFTERYLYLPSVGFCLLIVVLAAGVLRRVPEKQRLLAGAVSLAVAVLVFAGVTMARNPDWQDNATLFGGTLESSPQAPFVHIMVAAAASEQSSASALAEEHYRKAAELAAAEVPPDRVNLGIAYKGLAAIFSERSDFGAALAMLERAHEAAPDDPEIDGERGLILTKAGRWDEASAYLQKAAASREDANVMSALGIYEQRRNRNLDAAAAYFQRALAIHTAQDAFRASVHNNLGSVYGEQGKYAEAIEHFNAAISIAPYDPEYHLNLATALAATGQYDAARAELQGLLAKDPGYEPARELMEQLGGR